MKIFQDARGRVGKELISGAMVSVIALPLALAFGVAAYGPLGAAYGAIGAIAGLTGAALTGLLASLFGGCPPQVTGPTGPMSVVARSTIASLLAAPVIQNLPESQQPAAIIWLFGISVVLGGFLQWGLAKTRLGNLVRGLPYPVVAGFMNGVSLLILIDQIRPFLGWPSSTEWVRLLSLDWPPEVLAGLGASLATAAIIILLPKITKALPPTFVGLVGGTAIYYGLGFLLNLPFTEWANNPQIIGPIPSAIPLPRLILDAWTELPLLAEPDILVILLSQAVVLGLLGTIDTLLTSVIADLRTGDRHDSSKELFGQGLGNVVSGIFGGLPGAGATVRTLSNIETGGRTGLSGAFHGLLILLVMVFLGPVFQIIPLPVLAAILVVIAVKMVDVWSVELTRKRSAWGDSLVLWLVTIVTLMVNLIIAVAAGLVVAAFLFVRRQKTFGASLNFSDGIHIRSCVQRSRTQEEILIREGYKIQIIQVQGSLFFGSSDDLMGRLESEAAPHGIIVLDMEKLGSLDLTGAKMLLDLLRKWKRNGQQIFWGGWQPSSKTGLFLWELGISGILPEARRLSTSDRALEKAEDLLLSLEGLPAHEITVEELEFLKELTPEENKLILKLLREKALQPGDFLFYQGQTSKDLYFVLEGTVEVHGQDPVRNTVGRVSAYGPGQHLGLMAWLESKPKEYTARAATSVKLAWIPDGALDRLLATHPNLGLHLMKSWATQLSVRVRRFQNTELHLAQGEDRHNLEAGS